MSRCQQCGKTNPPSKGRRARKFCSKKCGSAYAHRRYQAEGRYYTKKNPDWGKKSRENKERKQKNEEEWDKWSAIWLTRPQVAAKLGISTSALHCRLKQAQKKGTIETMTLQHGNTHKELINPDHISLLAYTPDPIPTEYMSAAEAAAYLNVGIEHVKMSYPSARKWAHPTRPNIDINIYSQTQLDEFVVQRDAAAAKQREKNKLKTRKRHELAKEKAIAEKEGLLSGLLTAKEVAEILSFTSEGPVYKRISNNTLPFALVHKRVYYFDPLEVEKLRIALTQKREEVHKRQQQPRVPLTTDKWGSAALREQRLFKRLIAEIKDPEISDRSLAAITKNIDYVKDARRTGLARKFECKNCYAIKPYYDFYYTTHEAPGRQATCVMCVCAVRRAHEAINSAARKKLRQKNYRQKFRVLIAGQIKQDMSSTRGKYSYFSIEDIWKEINIQCGYTIDDFISWIEIQFDSNMNWDNHGRGKNSYHWQMDHIIPRSALKYSFFSDANFVKCWSLKNLRPLNAIQNILQGTNLMHMSRKKRNINDN